MEEVLHYLDLKNRYYEKFLTVTGRLLEEAKGDRWDRIGEVVDARERVLHILRSFDFQIARLFDDLDPTAFDLERYRDRVRGMFVRRGELVTQIVAMDLELISRIDEVKSDALREKALREFTPMPADKKLPGAEQS